MDDFDLANEQNSIVCFLWHTENDREYTAKHVNYFADMVSKNMSLPYRFICVTDDTEGFSDKVELFKLPESASWIKDVKTPEKQHLPSSYRRLWLFSEEAKCLGDRILQLDIDVLIVKDLAPLFTISDDFVGWRPMSEARLKIKAVDGAHRIGGGTWLLRTGTNTHIWDDFSPEITTKIKKIGWRGSDQAWLSYNFAKTCAVFPDEMGIYHSQDGAKEWDKLPENARLVHFNGKIKPWHVEAKNRKWFHDFINPFPVEESSKQVEEFSKQIKTQQKKNHSKLSCATFLWGNKPYNADYVNRLFNSIDRNLSHPHKNICFTNNPEGIREGIEIKPLTTEGLKGNLKKLEQFNPNNGLEGRILSFDLDNVIIGSLDEFAENNSKFIICEAINKNRKGKNGGNVMAFNAGYGNYIWEKVHEKYNFYKRKSKGMERFLFDKLIKTMDFWPKGKVVSYRHNIKTGKVKDLSKVAIISCHGKPNPADIKDKIIVDNWK